VIYTVFDFRISPSPFHTAFSFSTTGTQPSSSSSSSSSSSFCSIIIYSPIFTSSRLCVHMRLGLPISNPVGPIYPRTWSIRLLSPSSTPYSACGTNPPGPLPTVISPHTGAWNILCLLLNDRSFLETSQRSFANAASWVRSYPGRTPRYQLPSVRMACMPFGRVV